MTMKKSKPKKKPRLKHYACKPCWELHYCPYGWLVEYSPSMSESTDLNSIRSLFAEWEEALASGKVDVNDLPEVVRRYMFFHPVVWEELSQYDTDELRCNVFGHICPVFISSSRFTETKEFRRHSRHIPRQIMLKVVRRDGQICGSCSKNVPDNEVEFDHKIPYSRGGPTTVENLRLLCCACNQKKTDSLDELLERAPKQED